jgi:hypothetical protein
MEDWKELAIADGKDLKKRGHAVCIVMKWQYVPYWKYEVTTLRYSSWLLRSCYSLRPCGPYRLVRTIPETGYVARRTSMFVEDKTGLLMEARGRASLSLAVVDRKMGY